jgi:hypothetical protein
MRGLSTMLDARRCDSPQLVVEVCWKVPQLPRPLSTGKPLAWRCASLRCVHGHSDVTHRNSLSLVSRFTLWVRWRRPHRCHLRVNVDMCIDRVHGDSPSSYAHLMLHSAYPKASSRHFELCLRLGYGACMRLELRGIGATLSLAHRQPLGALVLPTIISPIELVYAREHCVPSMSHSPCLWLSYHVYSRAGAPPSATVLSATASDALVAPMFRRTRGPASLPQMVSRVGAKSLIQ